MTDVVVTCPMDRWAGWIAEGQLPGQGWDGETDYHWFGRGYRPNIVPGERVYIVAHGKLRGYAPLVATDIFVTGRARDEYSIFRWGLNEDNMLAIIHKFPLPLPEWWWPGSTWGLVRRDGAVAVTIPEPIRGFQGFRYRWWPREQEVSFPGWCEP
jgi:hypothetical protein